MLVLINPHSGGGTAMKKWRGLSSHLLNLSNGTRAYEVQDKDSFPAAIEEAYALGERDFTAAGGDGTVNLTLNTLVNLSSENGHEDIRLGAIGLGSSNDFHKPFCPGRIDNGIPLKLDFRHATLRDVGRIQFDNCGYLCERYFLSNASVGVTAEANHLFNNPEFVLRLLKRAHTPSAIVYAALKTILRHRNTVAMLKHLEQGDFTTSVTNLAILKNPHVSGDFRYQTSVPLDDGRFVVHLCHSMSLMELLRLLWALSHNAFEKVGKRRSWQVDGFSIQAPVPFAVEYDGEVIRTTKADFSVLHNFIKVCP